MQFGAVTRVLFEIEAFDILKEKRARPDFAHDTDSFQEQIALVIPPALQPDARVPLAGHSASEQVDLTLIPPKSTFVMSAA